MFQQVLKKLKKVLGPEHPKTLISVHNLGSVLKNMGKYEEAELMHQRTLKEREKVLGPEHPHTPLSASTASHNCFTKRSITTARRTYINERQVAIEKSLARAILISLHAIRIGFL